MQALSGGKQKAYQTEARQRWGETEAYAQYAARAKGQSELQQREAAEGLELQLAAFAVCMQNGHAPGSAEAQAQVRALQAHLSAHYYTCTPAILAALGEMYTADERFRRNIDRHGEGTAAFIGEAICRYCRG